MNLRKNCIVIKYMRGYGKLKICNHSAPRKSVKKTQAKNTIIFLILDISKQSESKATNRSLNRSLITDTHTICHS